MDHYQGWTRSWRGAADCAVWIVLKCTGTAHYRAVPYYYTNYNGWLPTSGA